MSGTSAIHEFLREARVPYTLVRHPPAFTAQEEAAATHVPGRDWAKVVVCFVDREPVVAILPAPSIIDLDRLLDLAGGSAIRLAQEDELSRVFPGCERGAMPPFGPLFGHAVFADVSLVGDREIVFNAGTHVDAIAMRWADFARIVKPIVGNFAERPMDRVSAFRLSFRE